MRRWISGDPADAVVATSGPVLVVAGGGTDVDEAMRALLDAAPGGDVVILRTAGAHGYGPYLYDELGGVDSVETLRVTKRRHAEHPWVASRLAAAEVIFLAGGDQSTYLETWRGTPIEREITGVLTRGGGLGGTSAGAMVLGEWAFSARLGSITSAEALSDPSDPRIEVVPGFLASPPLTGALVDTHVDARERIGRMATFLDHIPSAPGRGAGPPHVIGVDEHTAWVEPGARVMGTGSVTTLRRTDDGTLRYATSDATGRTTEGVVSLQGGVARPIPDPTPVSRLAASCPPVVDADEVAFTFVAERGGAEAARRRHTWWPQEARVDAAGPAGPVAIQMAPDMPRIADDPRWATLAPGAAPEAALAAWSAFVNDQFWLMAPCKAGDVGATATELPDGRIEVRYGDVGVTPGDRYVFSLGADGRVAGWEFALASGRVGTFQWEGWVAAASGVVSTRRVSADGAAEIRFEDVVVR
jgi:cyanophycinase